MSHHDKECSPGRIAPGTPFKPAEAVDYSEGAIVSRTLHETSAGSLIAFSFAAGERLSEHTSTKDAVVLVLEGEVEVSIAGQRSRLTTGTAVLMPADVPHAVVAPGACKFLLTLLRPDKSPASA